MASSAQPDEYRFMRMREVTERLGVTRVTVYKLIKCDGFPPPIKLGGASVWRSDRVSEWMDRVSG